MYTKTLNSNKPYDIFNSKLYSISHVLATAQYKETIAFTLLTCQVGLKKKGHFF